MIFDRYSYARQPHVPRPKMYSDDWDAPAPITDITSPSAVSQVMPGALMDQTLAPRFSSGLALPGTTVAGAIRAQVSLRLHLPRGER